MISTNAKNVRILIVDDDADDRRLFIEAVKEIDEHFNVDEATDGRHALDLLNQGNLLVPDLIFLDLRMPRYNGQRCLLELKKDARWMHIPVIIYTTSNEVEEAILLAKLGAIHFISKPSDPREIYYVLSSILEEQLL